MKKLINSYWQYVVLILLSLTPILWFVGKGEVIVNGLDTNFPLDPLIWFSRRFFLWNDTINAGIDASSSLSGLFFHLLQVFPYLLGFSLKGVEVFTMIFWFGAIVFSGYFFIQNYTESKIARLIFTLIYAYNIYLYNTWENIKVSNLALVVGIPLTLGLVGYARRKSIENTNFIFYSSLVAIVISGAGINPAYMFVIVLTLLLYTALAALYERNLAKEIIKRTALLLITIVLINMYWIMPLFRSLFLIQGVRGPEDIGFTNWVSSLSENTSIVNVVRLFGAWDWYAEDESGFPLYIPYALNYFKNLPFIIFSFVVPTLALVSLIVRTKVHRHLYVFFGVIAVFAIFMGTGLHPPTGVLYAALLRFIPYLSFFRSPWYIFTPMLVLSYAGLLALLVQKIQTKIDSFSKAQTISKASLWFVILVFAIGHLLYSYPLITGKIYRPGRPDSFYVAFPDYIFDAGEALENHSDARVITYPDDQLEAFEWGYRGTESILSLFSDKEVIAPSFAFQGDSLSGMLERFYVLLKSGQHSTAANAMKFFGADALLSKGDSSSIIRTIDEEITGLNKSVYGEWYVYTSEDKVDKVFSPHSAAFVVDNKIYEEIYPILDINNVVVNPLDSEVARIPDIENFAPTYQRVGNITSGSITESKQIYSLTAPQTGYYTLLVESKGLQTSDITFESRDISLQNASMAADDLYILVEDVYIEKGEHSFAIIYPENPNLIAEDTKEFDNTVLGLRSEELPVSENTLVAFNATESEKRLVIPIKETNPFLNYLFAFDYKYFYGPVPVLDIIQRNGSVIYRVTPHSPGVNFDWKHFDSEIELFTVDSQVELSIRMPKYDSKERSKAFVENLTFKRMYDNNVYLGSESLQDLHSPEVSYKKISPVEYEVTVSGVQDNYSLVFLENYSSDWELRSEDDIGKPLHFTSYGYANGWYIAGNEDEQKITIYYKGQDYLRLGVCISIITALACISCFIFKNEKK